VIKTVLFAMFIPYSCGVGVVTEAAHMCRTGMAAETHRSAAHACDFQARAEDIR